MGPHLSRRFAIMLVPAILIGACRTAAPPDDAGGFPTELGRPPSERIDDGTVPARAPTGATRSPATGSPATGTDPPDPADGDDAPIRGPFRTIGSVDDARGDHGTTAPGYADLRRVVIRDDRVDARVIVTVDAPIPDPMPDNEQMAIGVDLYREHDGESDYQVLALGTADGWLAFLHTPGGLVPYPGSFAIDEQRLLFQVAWSDLGDMSGTAFSAFLDWDRRHTVLSRTASDRAPARGTAPFGR